MGISGLKPALRKLAPKCIGYMPISTWYGWPVAIDSGVLLFQHYAAVTAGYMKGVDPFEADIDLEKINKMWLSSLMGSLMVWVREGVTPVIVFEGLAPEAKEIERKRRKKNKTSAADKAQSLINLYNEDPLSINDTQRKKMRGYLVAQYRYSSAGVKDLKEFLDGVGIPFVQATGEAEKLCCSLASENKVMGVWTEDTDILPHGCPFAMFPIKGKTVKKMMFNPYTGRKEKHFELFHLPTLLEETGMTMEQFIEYCTCLGCDYNSKLKGKGPIPTYKLIKDYGSVDEFPASLKVDNLNLETCSELFGYIPSEKITCEDKHAMLYDPHGSSVKDNGIKGKSPPRKSSKRSGLVDRFHIDPEFLIGKPAPDIFMKYGLVDIWKKYYFGYKNFPPPRPLPGDDNFTWDHPKYDLKEIKVDGDDGLEAEIDITTALVESLKL